jgi:hypothetical protein
MIRSRLSGSPPVGVHARPMDDRNGKRAGDTRAHHSSPVLSARGVASGLLAAMGCSFDGFVL